MSIDKSVKEWIDGADFGEKEGRLNALRNIKGLWADGVFYEGGVKEYIDSELDKLRESNDR